MRLNAYEVPDDGWRTKAACKGSTELFFPERGQSDKAAREICRLCPVIVECREYAIAEVGYNEPGVYGGMSWQQRRIEQRRRRRAS